MDETKQVPFGLATARRNYLGIEPSKNNPRVAEAKKATGGEFTQTNTRIRSEKEDDQGGRVISEQPTERKRALFSRQTEHSFCGQRSGWWVGAIESPIQYAVAGSLLIFFVQFVPTPAMRTDRGLTCEEQVEHGATNACLIQQSFVCGFGLFPQQIALDCFF